LDPLGHSATFLVFSFMFSLSFLLSGDMSTTSSSSSPIEFIISNILYLWRHLFCSLDRAWFPCS
jgi:hypothetical protein